MSIVLAPSLTMIASRGMAVLDVAERAVVVHRRRVVVGHRLHRPAVALDLLGDRRAATACRPGTTTASASSAALSCAMTALPSPTRPTSVGHVRRQLLGGDVELDDAHVRVEARRQAEVHDPVEPGAEQHDQVGFLQRVRARRADRQRVVVGHHALAHRRVEERQLGRLDERAHLVLGARPRHALADDHERPLGASAGRRSRPRRRSSAAWLRGGGGIVAAELHVVLVDPAEDHVVGQVEVGRARAGRTTRCAPPARRRTGSARRARRRGCTW